MSTLGIFFLLFVAAFGKAALPVLALAMGALGASLATNKKKGFVLGFALTMLLPHGILFISNYGGKVRSAYNTTKFTYACRRAEDDRTRITPVMADGIHILAPKFGGAERDVCEGFCAWIDNPLRYLDRGGAPAFSFVEKARVRISGTHGNRIEIIDAPRAVYAIRFIHTQNGDVTERLVEVTDRRTGRTLSRVRQASFEKRTCPSTEEFLKLVNRSITPIRDARTQVIHEALIGEARTEFDHPNKTPNFQLKSPRGAHRLATALRAGHGEMQPRSPSCPELPAGRRSWPDQ